jgi:hypothetical protein
MTNLSYAGESKKKTVLTGLCHVTAPFINTEEYPETGFN